MRYKMNILTTKYYLDQHAYPTGRLNYAISFVDVANSYTGMSSKWNLNRMTTPTLFTSSGFQSCWIWVNIWTKQLEIGHFGFGQCKRNSSVADAFVALLCVYTLVDNDSYVKHTLS